MTATAFQDDYRLSAAPEKTVEKDRLVLMVAIMAPLSGLFWSGIGWYGYRAAMFLLS